MERGTQQENSCTKHAVTNRLSVTATLGREKEAPAHWNLLGQTFLQKENKGVSFCELKQTDYASKITGWLQNVLHNVHRYIIG